MNKKIFLVSAVAVLAAMQAGAQTKIGDNPTTINANAVLELESSNKGLLLPRLPLTSTAATAPLTAHVAGMAVYNTATTGDVTPGYYYNDGTKWVRISGNLDIIANNGLTRVSDSIQLGGALTRATAINATGANNLVVNATGVGSGSNDQNQGFTVIATAANNNNRAIGTRSNLLVPASTTVVEARGSSNTANVVGTVSGTATGSYNNAVLRPGSNVASGSTVTGASGDVEVLAGTGNLDNTRTLTGARFGSDATNGTAARTTGVTATAVNSASSNIGVAASANMTEATLKTAIATQPVGFSTGVYSNNNANNANATAGYFTGSNTANQSSVLKAIANPGNSLAAGTELFAAQSSVTGQDVATSATSSPSTFRAQVNQATTNGNNVRVQGSLNEASSGGKGLGNFSQPQATGTTGLADYTGATDADPNDYIVGVRGAAYTTGNKTNGLNVVGVNFGGNFNSSVGGYFFPGNGTSNLGTVSQINGVQNAGWKDATFAGKNVAVVAMDASAGTPKAIAGTNRAIYSSGSVQLANLPATGNTALVGIDSLGNLSTTAVPAAVTANNGLTRVADSIQLGGTLTSNVVVTGNEFTSTFSSTQNTDEGAALNAVANPGNAIPAGNNMYASKNIISGNSAGPASGPTTTLRAQYNSATSSSNNTRVFGSLNEAAAAGQGLGVNNTPQATGTTGLADYNGTGAAAADDYLVGVRGATFTSAATGNVINALNVVGVTFDGSFQKSVGGYFFPSNGSSNLGTVSQINGTQNAGWKDGTFAGKNVAVVAMDASVSAPKAITATNLAVYTNGNVQLSNLPATGNTALVGIDSLGNLSTTAIPTPITATNGLTLAADTIQLGGTLTSDVIFDGATNKKGITVTGNANTELGLFKVQNNVTAPNPVGTSNYTQVISTSLDGVPGTGMQAGDVVANKADAYSSSDDYLVVGSENFSTTPLSNTVKGDFTHAIGTNGVSFANGSLDASSPNGMVIGVSGGVSFNDAASNWNAVGTEGYLNFRNNTTGKAAAGHFDGNGTDSIGTGFGMIGSMGDDALYETMFDPTLAGYHIGVAAVNHTPTPKPTDLALYTEGNVKMMNLSGKGTNVITMDASGNVGVAKAFAAQATLNFSASANGIDDETVTVNGVVDGDAIYLGVSSGAIVPLGNYSAFVSAPNTVTIRFTNNSAAAQTTSGTFKIKIMQ